MSPSAVGKSWYGTMLGCALPMRRGTAPPIRKFAVWLARQATCTSSSARSMCWPSPVRSRCASAARTPTVAYSPVRMSVSATPTFWREAPGRDAVEHAARHAGERRQLAVGRHDAIRERQRLALGAPDGGVAQQAGEQHHARARHRMSPWANRNSGYITRSLFWATHRSDGSRQALKPPFPATAAPPLPAPRSARWPARTARRLRRRAIRAPRTGSQPA